MSEFSFMVHAATDNRATSRIRLIGSITGANVGEVLLRLTPLFDGADSILLDFSDVREIDLAGLKLFCSCHRNLLFSGKMLRLTGCNHAVMRGAIPPEGYQRGSGCGIDWHHSCIWLAVG